VVDVVVARVVEVVAAVVTVVVTVVGTVVLEVDGLGAVVLVVSGTPSALPNLPPGHHRPMP
jgi:hypothetical protein